MRQRRAVGYCRRDRRVLHRTRSRRRCRDRQEPAVLHPRAPNDDGSYDTGIVYPTFERYPAGERTAYTGAAVIMAADAICGGTPAARLFVPTLTVD